MYIKEEDFHYMENLHSALNDDEKRRFLHTLLKAYGIRPGEFKEKIKIVGDDIFDVRGIEYGEFITRTAIKKAYKSITANGKT
jgi:hypothetical protein